MRTSPALLTILCLTACSKPEAAPPAQSPEAVLLQEIETQGAKPVFDRLTSGGPQAEPWNNLVGHVEKGEMMWIHVAGELLKGSDTAHSQRLHRAFATALLKNPETVLAIIGPDLPAADVCFFPFEEPTQENIRAYKVAAAASLDSVLNPALAIAKDACLHQLSKP